jgi:macrolide-specific efflux system membrane fusion protein
VAGAGAGSSAGGSANGGSAHGGSANGGAANGGNASAGTAAGNSTSGGFVELADLKKLQVTAAFAEADATKLKEKQAATVTWNALSGAQAPAKVTAIDPQATTVNNVVTYGVTLSLDSTPAGAKPGQTVSVSVVTGQVADAVFVNSGALTTLGNRHTVTVMTGGQPQVRLVEVGLQGAQTTQITAGLAAGEQVALPASGTTGPAGLPGGGFPGGAFPGGGLNGGGFNGGARPGGGTGRTG